MLDSNERVIRPNKKKSAQLQKEFIRNWLAENQEEFDSVMQMLRERDPRLWARLYIDNMKLVIPKATNVNIRHSIDKDMQELMMLGRTCSKAERIDGNSEPKGLENFAQYEELSDVE